jgi:hypothetical protein
MSYKQRFITNYIKKHSSKPLDYHGERLDCFNSEYFKIINYLNSLNAILTGYIVEKCFSVDENIKPEEFLNNLCKHHITRTKNMSRIKEYLTEKNLKIIIQNTNNFKEKYFKKYSRIEYSVKLNADNLFAEADIIAWIDDNNVDIYDVKCYKTNEIERFYSQLSMYKQCFERRFSGKKVRKIIIINPLRNELISF